MRAKIASDEPLNAARISRISSVTRGSWYGYPKGKVDKHRGVHIGRRLQLEWHPAFPTIGHARILHKRCVHARIHPTAPGRPGLLAGANREWLECNSS